MDVRPAKRAKKGCSEHKDSQSQTQEGTEGLFSAASGTVSLGQGMRAEVVSGDHRWWAAATTPSAGTTADKNRLVMTDVTDALGGF